MSRQKKRAKIINDIDSKVKRTYLLEGQVENLQMAVMQKALEESLQKTRDGSSNLGFPGIMEPRQKCLLRVYA